MVVIVGNRCACSDSVNLDQWHRTVNAVAVVSGPRLQLRRVGLPQPVGCRSTIIGLAVQRKFNNGDVHHQLGRHTHIHYRYKWKFSYYSLLKEYPDRPVVSENDRRPSSTAGGGQMDRLRTVCRPWGVADTRILDLTRISFGPATNGILGV